MQERRARLRAQGVFSAGLVVLFVVVMVVGMLMAMAAAAAMVDEVVRFERREACIRAMMPRV